MKLKCIGGSLDGEIRDVNDDVRIGTFCQLYLQSKTLSVSIKELTDICGIDHVIYRVDGYFYRLSSTDVKNRELLYLIFPDLNIPDIHKYLIDNYKPLSTYTITELHDEIVRQYNEGKCK